MRKNVINLLHHFCNNNDALLAAFISGSNAFERDDEISDIDLRIVANEKYFKPLFSELECFLNASIGIREYYIPKYSQYNQRFYKLRKISNFNILDVVLLNMHDLPLFLDKNRMGPAPLILYDTLKIIQPIDSPKELYEKFEEKIDDLQQQFLFLSRIIVERAIKRNRYTEAVHFYNTRVIAPLVEVLRHKYSPARQDFGLRYLQHDLPEHISAIMDELHKIASLEDIKNNLDLAEELFIKTLETLQQEHASCKPSL